MNPPTVETILWSLALGLIVALASWALSRASAVAEMQRTLERTVAGMVGPAADATASLKVTLERLHALERTQPMLEERLAGYVATNNTRWAGHETWCDGRHNQTSHEIARHENEIALIRESMHSIRDSIHTAAGRAAIAREG